MEQSGQKLQKCLQHEYPYFFMLKQKNPWVVVCWSIYGSYLEQRCADPSMVPTLSSGVLTHLWFLPWVVVCWPIYGSPEENNVRVSL